MKLYFIALLFLFSFCTTREVQDSETSHLLEKLESPSTGNASLPYLIKGDDEKLYLSWVEKRDSNRVLFKYAMLDSSEWSTPEQIAEGTDWFINWADYPMIAIDRAGNKIAHYLAKSSAGTYSYDVNVVLKPVSQPSWSAPIIPHTDGTPTEHGFVTMLPTTNETFILAWLDGRNTGGGGHSDHGSGGAMTLRAAEIDMKGNLSDEAQLDGRVCDCCQTSGAMTASGPMIVYRDRSVDEIRDMAYVNKTNSEWRAPSLVAMDNWKIDGCPVNGPRMAAYENTITAAWYTSALGRPAVKVAFKIDSAFEEPIIVDRTDPVGRVDIAMLNEHTAIVSWLDGGETSTIKYRIVEKNGSMSTVNAVTETSESRGSGFPQIEIFEGAVYFAWTHLEGDQSSIKIARIRLSI